MLLQGAILTFSPIGFEDTQNVAGECRGAQRTVPLGLVSAMLVATPLRIAVAATAVSMVSWREPAAAPGPGRWPGW